MAWSFTGNPKPWVIGGAPPEPTRPSSAPPALRWIPVASFCAACSETMPSSMRCTRGDVNLHALTIAELVEGTGGGGACCPQDRDQELQRRISGPRTSNPDTPTRRPRRLLDRLLRRPRP